MKKTLLISYDYLKGISEYGGTVLNEQDSKVLSDLLEVNEKDDNAEDLVESYIESGKMTGNILLYLAAIGLETITLQEQYTILGSEIDELKIDDIDRIVEMFTEENIENGL